MVSFTGTAGAAAPHFAAASTTANNVGALTDLYGSFLGKPVIKVASAAYALKTTAQSFMNKKNVNSAASNKGE